MQTTPARPRFIRELVVVPTADAWLVDGMPQLKILRGAVTRTFLARLLSLLDGTRDIAQVSEALGEDAARVRAAVELLSENGLVEDGAEDAGDDRLVNAETLDFFRRVAGTTGEGLVGAQAYRRLVTSNVVICATGGDLSDAGRLRQLLADTGMCGVGVVNTPANIAGGSGSPGTSAAPSLLVSYSANGEDVERNDEVDAWCASRGVPWLRAVLDEREGYADIGPLFRRGDDPCYRCFTAVHSRTRTASSDASRRSPTAVLWESVIATEVLYWLTSIAPLVSNSGFRRYELDGWTAKDLCHPRLPDCDRCRPASGRGPGTALSSTAGLMEPAVLFEDYVGRMSGFTPPPRAQQDFARAAVALSRQTKRLPDCRQHALSKTPVELTGKALDGLRPGAPASCRPPTVDELATLLQMTGGIKHWGGAPEQVKRWAATGGNLGSVELFVAVRETAGLAPGFYCYQPLEHSLASLDWRDGGLDVGTFMTRVVPNESEELPAVMIVFTGAFHRLTRKYLSFAYRLLQLDAGAAMSQLHLAAASLRIASHTEPVWADDLIEAQLRIVPPGEQSTGIVSIGRRAMAGGRYTHKLEPGSARPMREFQGVELAAVLEMVRSESRTLEGDWSKLPSAPSSVPAHDASPPMDGGPSTGELLLDRRTVRRFADDPVSLDQVRAMARHALWSDGAEWPTEGQGAGTLSVWVLARRVDGITPGIYRYDLAQNRLWFIRPAPSAPGTVRLLTQPEFADAPLQLWITGDLASACARYGAWGHRQLLLRAGAAAHRVWFTGLAMGLQGAMVAGINPDAARSELGFDGYRQAGLIAVVAGIEAR